jgi:hypothetical protein
MPRKHGCETLGGRTDRTARDTQNVVIGDREQGLKLDGVHHSGHRSVVSGDPTQNDVGRERNDERLKRRIRSRSQRRGLDPGQIVPVFQVRGATEEQALVATRLTRNHKWPNSGSTAIERANG